MAKKIMRPNTFQQGAASDAPKKGNDFIMEGCFNLPSQSYIFIKIRGFPLNNGKPFLLLKINCNNT